MKYLQLTGSRRDLHAGTRGFLDAVLQRGR
jgi:hypothetical protein